MPVFAVVAVAACGLLVGWAGAAHAVDDPPPIPTGSAAPEGPSVSPTLILDPTPAPSAGEPTPPPTPAAPTADPSGPGGGVPPIVIDPSDPLPTPAPGEGELGDAPDLPEPDDPGTFDIVGKVKKAITGWFRDLVVDGLNWVLDLIGESVLATPDVSAHQRVVATWSQVQTVANTGYVLLVLAGGVVVMSHETLQTRYTLKQVTPRIVVGFIAVNASLSVIGEAIDLANALTQAMLGQGVDPEQTAQTLRTFLVDPLNAEGVLFLILMGLVALVMAVILLLTYIVRVALVIILVAAAPLALACHALPHTESLAKLWWRAVIGCLLIQVAQSVTLVTAVRVFFNNDTDGGSALGLTASGALVNFLIALVLLYVLIRIPFWTFAKVFAGSGIGGHSMLMSMGRSYLIGRGLAAMHGGSSTGGRPGGGSGGGRPGPDGGVVGPAPHHPRGGPGGGPGGHPRGGPGGRPDGGGGRGGGGPLRVPSDRADRGGPAGGWPQLPAGPPPPIPTGGPRQRGGQPRPPGGTPSPSGRGRARAGPTPWGAGTGAAGPPPRRRAPRTPPPGSTPRSIPRMAAPPRPPAPPRPARSRPADSRQPPPSTPRPKPPPAKGA